MNLNILLHTGKIQKNSFFFPNSSSGVQNSIWMHCQQWKYKVNLSILKKKIISKGFTLDYLMNLKD